MKHILTVLIVFLLAFFNFTACTKKAPNSQTPETSNSTKPQATQQIQTLSPSPSPSVIKEAQGTINKDNSITKTEVLSFFSGNKEFATKMLQHAAPDMNSLEQVMAMILPPLLDTYNSSISFDVFNNYTKKFINKTYADSEIAKFAKKDYAGCPDIYLLKDERKLFIFGSRSEKLLIKNVDITGNDSALITCSWGFISDEPESMADVSFQVQFGKANSQLYFKSITKQLQPTNNNNSITKSEILSFFNSDNEFAAEMLHYPVTDMNNLEQVMAMMLYSLGALHENPISFDLFNKYTKKYLNKIYTDSDFAKFATDEEVCGVNVIMEKRILYIYCVGGQDIFIKNVEITGNDSALFNCSRGLNRDEPDTMREVSFYVQFGRSDSQLHIKSIWETDTKEVSR